jgi:hypothetical protein
MVMHQCLTGLAPFGNASEKAIQESICNGDRPDISLVPEEYHHILAMCWTHGLPF